MRPRNYRIAVLSTNGKVLHNRYVFLKALAALGNDIRVISYEQLLKSPLSSKDHNAWTERFKKKLDDYSPDFLLLFCVDYVLLHLVEQDFLLSCFPHVSLWDSNPLRSLFFLSKHRENHRFLLVLDSKIVDDLRAVGMDQAAYFPYYYADPAVFSPQKTCEQYLHPVSFAGTFAPAHMVPSRFSIGSHQKNFWTEQLISLKDAFIELRNRAKWYVDVFGYLKDKMDIWSTEFVEISDALMYSQKWIERIQLFDTLSAARIDTHIYGGLQGGYAGKNLNHKLNVVSPYLHLHGFLNKHTELPKLYNSSRINLCCTQFPRACHERVFQVASCSGFILHEWKEDVNSLFSPGNEIVLYRSLEELPDLIAFYLRKEKERKRVAEAARKRFLAEHTPLHRARRFMEIAQERL
ncbi:MAG: glycosyltransferase [Alphaproteobacteria bacterium]|uniref:Glycosyltransferase n=1 Tax=Candidatus Nitrobium versatile TaxID=2884831 RepID=A0A953JB00_9BACT|nr:glycosyltransferase [Candidatus Nitrobium versatile]